jgi:type IV secretory pathway VirB4 component
MAQQKQTTNKEFKASTQQYIDIAEIHDDTVILKDNSLVAVLLVSSINFALKSEEEQNAIIEAYMSFINSLSFPVQIVIQSRRLNIDDYLESLKQKEKEQTNELLKVQIADYIDYIKELIELGDIMTKRFYVVIRYNPQEGTKRQGVVSKIINSFKVVQVIGMKKEKFLKYRQELDRRVSAVQSALASMTLNSQRLDTQSLIELYYNSYNPDSSQRQKMTKISNLRIE